MWGIPWLSGFQVSLWVSTGIATGIAAGTRIFVISGVCFKWHKFWQAPCCNSTHGQWFWRSSLWPHNAAFSTYLSIVTIWINIINITITTTTTTIIIIMIIIIIIIIITIKLIKRFDQKRLQGSLNHKQSLKRGIATQGPLSLHAVNHIVWKLMADPNLSLS